MRTYDFADFTIRKNEKYSFTFVAEASSLMMNSMPLSFNVRSNVTGVVKTFEFEKVEVDEEEVIAWQYYNPEESEMKVVIYND